MHKQFIFAVFLFIAAFYNASYSKSYNCNDFKTFREIKKPEEKKVIKFGQTKDQKRFLFKQLASHPVTNLIKTVAEVHATRIAEAIGIHTNSIILIPAGEPCRLKKKQNFAATLHSYIDAKNISRFKEFQKISIWQETRPQFPQEKRGLPLTGIKGFARYHELARIAAFDTFVGNHDRHRGNILYNPDTHTFYAIDHTAAFRRDVAKQTLSKIKSYKKELLLFSASELKGFCVFRDTLRHLSNKYPVAKLHRQAKLYFDQANYKNYIYNPSSIEHAMAGYYRSIARNYESNQILLSYLDKLIDEIKMRGMKGGSSSKPGRTKPSRNPSSPNTPSSRFRRTGASSYAKASADKMAGRL